MSVICLQHCCFANPGHTHIGMEDYVNVLHARFGGGADIATTKAANRPHSHDTTPSPGSRTCPNYKPSRSFAWKMIQEMPDFFRRRRLARATRLTSHRTASKVSPNG